MASTYPTLRAWKGMRIRQDASACSLNIAEIFLVLTASG
jgi:hypothetical protein